MKPGSPVVVSWVRPEGVVKEPARIARVMPYMRPLPAGYVPVRFDADGARLLVAESIVEARAA